jgi:hypothetical protein
MTLMQFEQALKLARARGAIDETPVWAVSKAMDYSRKVKGVKFQTPPTWPENEWPVVIQITE